MDDIAAAVQDWLTLLGTPQPPKRGVLIVPSHMLKQFQEMDEETQASILAEVDEIASQYGLLTPTILIGT